MRKERCLGLRQLFLILSALSCCRSLEVSIPERQYEVARGGDITLTCSFIPARPGTSPLLIQWEAKPDTQDEPTIPVATFSQNNPVDIAPLYEGRASLTVEHQQANLRLTKVTMQDSRNFQCSVIIPGDDEGTTVAITSLLVLEPPSKPICRIQGKAEYWNNISLTCMSEQGSPEPSYVWTSYNVQNIPRVLPPTANQKHGVLSLLNISMATSGFYICLSENRIGSASCNFTLSVMPSTMNLGSTAAIIGGVLAGVLCLGIVIYCCYRKKGKKDKYAQGSPGAVEFQDTPAVEVEEQYGEDKHSRPHIEEKDTHGQNSYIDTRETAKHQLEDDQYSYDSQKERLNGQGNNANVQPDLDGQHDRYGGNRDRLDDQRDRYGGSRDRLDDQRDQYRSSRDRLDDQRDQYRSSRDRLDDQREGYGGSRDRLDDQRDQYRSSRDRLDDQRDQYRSSRDRLDDQRDRYHGSRDRLDNQSDR